jgi:hypothetical protein
MHFLNQYFNSVLLAFYMFRTSCVHLQEDHCTCSFIWYVFHAFMQLVYEADGCVIEHIFQPGSLYNIVFLKMDIKMFETCRRLN